ncbi:hypothetical protein TEA_010298 [Camellia sinensis var. sinensis]|uniref:MADS-box domain-containing protein n=1 Tax=Camellia sinensis var. sinensis TaxID=542762 RepID=A0A4S4D900_CAMSN|nr:hypothetical protein TEA_010298 [Camellia sinensis var. sinensis]
MEENTLINSSSSLVSGSEGESNTLAPDKSTLESENWGGDFCNSDNIDSDSTEFEIGGLHYGPYSDDDGFRFETKETNFVWDGWEAALIVSKRMLADYYVKSSSEKEDSGKVLTLEPYENETHFGKSNARHTLELEGSGLVTRKEDFEKIFDQSVVEDEYSKLCEILDSCKCDPLVAIAEGKVKVDQFSTLREHDLCDTIRNRGKNLSSSLLAIAMALIIIVSLSGGVSLDFDVVGGWGQKGEIEVGAVEGSDAKGEMVGGYLVGSCGFGRLGGLGLGFGFEWNDISPNEVAIALEMLRNYEPLKEDCKMQLTLELTNEKSYRILDSLVLEAWGGVDMELLRNCLPNTADDVFLAKDVTFACSCLADGLFIGLYELAAMKTSALQYFQEAVIFPLSDGCFGPFTDEFIEVIKIADHERRMQGDRFISVKHLLFGLSLSSVRRCVEMMLHGRVLDYTGQLALKLSSFSIYKLSRDAATILGDKNVGLEHLVLAIFYGKQENDRTGTAAQDDCSSLFFDEKKWDDYLLKHGLFKKTGELCNLCGTEAAVITFSNAGNTFAFGNPSIDSALDRYLSMTSSSSKASASFSSLFRYRVSTQICAP